MTPMLTLFLGILVWGGLSLAGYFFEWPFLAGMLVMAAGVLAAVIWAFDGAGRVVQWVGHE